MHALLHDDRGQLTLKRLWPWHQILAGGQAVRLDRALAAAAQAPLRAARPVRVPLRTTRISQSAPLLAELAGRLLEPRPVPARGVAMVTRLLADGTGPLYRQSARDDLSAVAARAVHALTR